MDDELENIIRAWKERVAENKSSLDQDPPYMEIKAKPHRASTVKENIPPKSSAQGKDESCIMGLPLGLEYERKKQRLQQELRMDYKRYMAQKKQLLEPGPLIHLDKRKSFKQPTSHRNGTTVMEDNSGLNRALRLAKVKTLCPKEDEEQPSALPKQCDRLGGPWDQDLESEEEYFNDELELMDRRSHRQTAAEVNHENRRFSRTNVREKRETPGGVREGRRSRALTRNEDAEFATGLIEAADREDSSQRKKERYRQELLEQIAEKNRNKKREKDLELRVTATGANDPEKQPNRIGWFGMCRRKDHLVVEPSAAGESETWRYDAHPKKTYVKDGDYLSLPGAGPPMSYWNVPLGGAVPTHSGNHSPHSQHSGSSFHEPPIQPGNEAAVGSQVCVFPPERATITRERNMNYADALKQQIVDQQERRQLQREEAKRYESRLMADMRSHQPWGRGGGGAPLRDNTGNLIADLSQMHKLNKEAYSNPELWQRRATAAMTACPVELPDPNKRVSGTAEEYSTRDASELPASTHVQTSQFARGNVFANQPDQQQLQERNRHKAFLKQQIDEKMRKKEEEREREKLEEEKEEKRVAEERAHLQKEYEEELMKGKRKTMEQAAKIEALSRLDEQKKEEAKLKRKEAEEAERRSMEEKENAGLKRQHERERQARPVEVHREPSPPVPTLQKKHRPHQKTPSPPTVDSLHSTAPPSERSSPGDRSPPVPACKNRLRAEGEQRDVFNVLGALRQQLRSEQKRLEDRLQQADWAELESPLSDRHQEHPMLNAFDMAMLRRQAPVWRPNSRKLEPRNLQRIHDSLQPKHTDHESGRGFSEAHKMEEMGVASRDRRDSREPYHLFSSQRSTAHDDYFDLSPPQQHDYLGVIEASVRGSLLESESAFIDPLGNALLLPHTPELHKSQLLSARERRRLAKQPQHPQFQDGAALRQPFGRHDDYTGDRLRQEAEPWGGGIPDRTGRLMALNRRGNTAEPVDLFDDDPSPSAFSLHNLNRQSSVETVATDPWMRPGTSDTLKCLDRSPRRDRLTT